MNHNRRMSARWPTLLLWAVVTASAVAWALKLFVSAPAAPAQVSVVGAAQTQRGDVTRVLGADALPPGEAASAAAPADTRFQLVGVLAPRSVHAAREGVALIAVDGKPPRAYRVGAVVEGDTVLKAVRARGADLGPAGGNVTVALNIPPPAPAATGTLPAAAGLGGVPTPRPAIAMPQPVAMQPQMQPQMPPQFPPQMRPQAAPQVPAASLPTPQPPMQSGFSAQRGGLATLPPPAQGPNDGNKPSMR